jgi:hypothetical protein
MKTSNNTWCKPTQRVFIRAASVILCVTAVAKLSVLFSDSRVLNRADPVFEFLNVRQLMLCAGLVEFIVVSVLLANRATAFSKLTALFTLSLAFLAYRTTRYILGVITPCNCMGVLVDWIPFLSPSVVDKSSMIMSGMLFTGSIGLLACQWRSERGFREERVPDAASEVSPAR